MVGAHAVTALWRKVALLSGWSEIRTCGRSFAPLRANQQAAKAVPVFCRAPLASEPVRQNNSILPCALFPPACGWLVAHCGAATELATDGPKNGTATTYDATHRRTARLLSGPRVLASAAPLHSSQNALRTAPFARTNHLELWRKRPAFPPNFSLSRLFRCPLSSAPPCRALHTSLALPWLVAAVALDMETGLAKEGSKTERGWDGQSRHQEDAHAPTSATLSRTVLLLVKCHSACWRKGDRTHRHTSRTFLTG